MFDVFISKNIKDSKYSDSILKFLSEHGISAFDSSQIDSRGDADYALQIDSAIEESKNMLVICSKNELGTGCNGSSRWVYYEWSTFRNEVLSSRKNGNLITVIVDDTDISEIALGLRKYEYIRLHELNKLLSYVSDKPRDAVIPEETKDKSYTTHNVIFTAIFFIIGAIALFGLYKLVSTIATSHKERIETTVEQRAEKPHEEKVIEKAADSDWEKGRSLYLEGSYEEAFKYLKNCDAPVPLLYMGTMYEFGWGVSKDRNKAIEYYRKAYITYQMGEYDEAKNALQRLNTSVVDPEVIKTLSYDDLRNEDPEYLFKTGMTLCDEDSMGPKDYVEAYRYISQSARLGNPHALEMMGDFQTSIIYGLNNPQEARKLYLSAAAAYIKQIELQVAAPVDGVLGIDGALCYKLGDLYRSKLADNDNALKYFKLGGDAGHSTCALLSGMMSYQMSQYEEALVWFNKVYSMTAAKYHLAMMYENGLGVPQDRSEAIMLYKAVSADHNNGFSSQAQSHLRRLGISSEY